MRYLPKSPSERQEMLAAIGAGSIDELFESIPEKFRLTKPLDLPGPLSESEIIQYFKARADENSRGYTSFLGAGVYSHLRSVVADAIIQRGEFLTSYTPYQAEFAQGTLTAIFEFQTLMCQLTGQEVANASMYDGSTALTEAILMAERLTDRDYVLVARSVHPEYRQVLHTYAKNLGLHVEEVGFTSSGQIDLAALTPEKLAKAAAVVVQSPNFFGVIEDLPPIAEVAHAHGALLVDTITEAVSLGIVRPPSEADIVAMEGQALGIPPSYGGPYVGVIATRDKFVRQMPGRLAGRNQRRRRQSRLRPHSRHSRTTYPSREGHFQHLHQRSPLRPRRHHSSLPYRQRRHSRASSPKSRQGALRQNRTGKNSRCARHFLRPHLQRIHRGISTLGKTHQSRTA